METKQQLKRAVQDFYKAALAHVDAYALREGVDAALAAKHAAKAAVLDALTRHQGPSAAPCTERLALAFDLARGV